MIELKLNELPMFELSTKVTDSERPLHGAKVEKQERLIDKGNYSSRVGRTSRHASSLCYL